LRTRTRIKLLISTLLLCLVILVIVSNKHIIKINVKKLYSAYKNEHYNIDSKSTKGVLRELPYPFRNAVSLADDIDGTHWQGDIAIQDDLFNKYGLNIGRSMYMYLPKIDTDYVAFTNQESATVSDSIINYPEFENSTYYLLRRYYEGGINYIHMWSTFETLLNQTAIIAQQRVKISIDGKNQLANTKIKVFRDKPSNFPGMRLYLTVNENVNNAIVQIIDRHNNKFNWCIGGVQDKSQCRWLSKLPPPNTPTLKAIFFNHGLEKKDNTNSPYDYKWSNINFIISGQPGAKANFEEVLFSAFNRKLVNRQIKLLKDLGVGFWMYSDHGGADYGANLMKQEYINGKPQVIYPNNNQNVWAQKDKEVDVTITNKAEGAQPGSDYYFADLTEKIGSIFYLFGNVPSGNYKGKDEGWGGYKLSELLMPYKLPNGRKVYDTERYYPGGWRERDKGNPYTITWNGRFNQALDYIFNKVNTSSPNLVYGPIITHLGFEGSEKMLGFKPHKIKPGYAFNAATAKSLAELSNRYYNFSGQIPEFQRLWVTSPSRLYRYAQIHRLLEDHIKVDKGSQIKISSWTDDVTGEKLPEDDFIGRDLAGVTIYVPDSSAATVKMDGHSIFDFTRNPKDSTGQESITFVDLSTLHIINDKIWPKKLDLNNGEALIKFSSEAPGSGKFLRVRSKNIQNPVALSIPVSGVNQDQHAQTNFSFWARTNNANTELSIAYVLDNGKKFDVLVSPNKDQNRHNTFFYTNKPNWQLTWGKPNQWRRYVVNFSDAYFNYTSQTPPRGRVKEIKLEVRNSDSIDIAQIAFGRDNPFPRLSKSNIFLGRVSSLEDGSIVTAHFKEGADKQVKTNHMGYFLFTDIPPNTVITSLDIHSKSTNQHVLYNHPLQLQSSIVGLKIPVNTGHSKNIYQTQYSNKIAWQPGLIPRNQRPSNRLKSEPEKQDKQFQVYVPNKMIHWGGMGILQEYDAIQYANNLGFLDRKERHPSPGPKDAFNVLVFGGCLFSGAQFSNVDPKINEYLEEKIRDKLHRPVEVPLFANTWLNPYSYNLIYDKYGKQYQPKLVIVEVMMSTFRNASPYLSAVENHLQLGANQSAMLDLNEDGSFFIRKADPSYFLKTKKWDLDMKGVTVHAMSTLTQPLPWMKRELNRSEKIISENLRIMRDKVSSQGGKLVLVLVQDRYALSQPKRGMTGQMKYDVDEADKRFRAIAHNLDVPYLNLVQELETKPNYLETQWVFDPHWTPKSHATAADIIMNFLVQKRLLPDKVA
jgi:hypothetical protein